MCALSVVSDYGSTLHSWNEETLAEFKKLIEQAKIFDIKTNQPNCEDPEKLRYLEIVEQKISKDE